MKMWIQEITLAGALIVLVMVTIYPVLHLMAPVPVSDPGSKGYVTLVPPLTDNNPEAGLTSFIAAPNGSEILLPAKAVTVRGFLVGSTARIIYLGGRDNAQLSGLDIVLYQSGAPVLQQSYPKPAVNQQYSFPDMGTPGPDEIEVLGSFGDRSQQVLLTASV